MQLLLEDERTDLNAADLEGNTALHWAVLYDHLKISYFLLMKGVQTEAVNKAGKRPRDIAKEEKSREILHLFVS